MIRKSFVLICFVISWLGAFSQITQVSGEISTNTVWQDTIHIVGDVRVLDGVTLSVNPGTHISFRDGCVVNIEGTFIAEGTADNKITFMNDSSGYFLFDNSPTGANGAMNDNDSSVIKYWDLPYYFELRNRFLLVKSFNKLEISYLNVLEFLRFNKSFIEINNSEMEISNCSFKDVFLYNDTCGLIKATDSSKLVIRNNNFDGIVAWGSDNVNTSTILFMGGSSSIVENNIFTGNDSESGSCLYLYDTDTVIIINNVFDSNECSQLGNGQAIYIDSCEYVSIDLCSFDNNGDGSANLYGGAVYSRYSKVDISNSIFSTNRSKYGSALYITNSDFKLFNNLFYLNQCRALFSDIGGTIYIGPVSQGSIVNCTLSDNLRDANNYGSSGIIIESENVILQNTIFYNNINLETEANYQLYIIEPNAFPVIKNCVLDSISYAYNCLPNGTIENLFDINPQFINNELDTYRLNPASACIDAGLFDAVAESILPDYDLAGDNRLNGSTIDIGAYEYNNNSRPVFEVNDTTMLEDSILLLQLCINDADIGDAHFVCITTDTTVLNVTGIVPFECGFAYTLVPKPNYFGETDVQIFVTDSTGTSNESLSKSYNLEIISVNDPPEIISVYDTMRYSPITNKISWFNIFVTIEDIDDTTGHEFSYFNDDENFYFLNDFTSDSCMLALSNFEYSEEFISTIVGIKVTDPAGGYDSISISLTAPFYNDLETFNNDKTLQLFPNPVNKTLCLKISDTKIIAGKIEILDVYGRILKNISYSKTDNDIDLNIDVSELPAGVYLLRLTTEKGNNIKRFIKE